MGEVRVANARTQHGQGVWVDRRSPLGNPFRVTAERTRDEAIAQYREWFTNLEFNTAAQKMLDRLVQLSLRPEGVTLVCHCTPLPCHADVIAAYIDAATCC